VIWRDLERRIAAAGGQPLIVHGGLEIGHEELAARVAAAASVLPEPTGPRPWRALVRQRDPLDLLLQTLACWRQGFSTAVMRDSMTDAQIADIAAWLQRHRRRGPSPAATRRL